MKWTHIRGLITAGFIAAVLTSPVASPSRLEAAEARAARRVLVISSLGGRFEPFSTFTGTLREEVGRQLKEPVEFLEVPVEMARFAQPAEGQVFADYLTALSTGGRIHLVVTLGGPAAAFVVRYRDRLLQDAPLLLASIDERRVRDIPPAPNQVVVPVLLEPSATIRNILQLLPDTRVIAVVLGNSPLERLWRVPVEREFAEFAGRVSFRWLNDLSLPEMQRVVGSLPANSAVYYGALYVDAAGVPHEQDGLPAICASSRSPVFGMYEEQLGLGIVGGPLASIKREARRASSVAVAILRGTPLAQIEIPPREPLLNQYDDRELRRFRIPEGRLPPGSAVSFRPPSPFSPAMLAAFGVVVLQAILIGGLLAQRARRRRAENRIRELNRGLLTAQEEERRVIARDLHDDFSQRLARLSMDAAEVVEGRSEPKEMATEIRLELSRLSKDVRSLASQLHPSTLQDLGLVEALRIECDRVGRASALSVRVEMPESWPQMRREAMLCLFRVAQESLRNVLRHARAGVVDVRLEAVDGTAYLAVRDDGVGFEAGRKGNANGSRGLGLLSMRERIDLVGGRIAIRSEPGRGTAVEAWVPIGEAGE